MLTFINLFILSFIAILAANTLVELICKISLRIKPHKAMQKIMQIVSHIGDLKKLVTFSQFKTCGESSTLANFVIFTHFQLRRI